MLNALSATTLPIYAGLGQAPNNAGLHTWWLGTQRLGFISLAIPLNETAIRLVNF